MEKQNTLEFSHTRKHGRTRKLDSSNQRKFTVRMMMHNRWVRSGTNKPTLSINDPSLSSVKALPCHASGMNNKKR